MSYTSLGQPAPTIAPGATIAPAASSDAATSPVDFLAKRRGFVAVPTMDLRDYVQAQVVTMGIGFIVGVTIGAALGNVIKGKAAITANRRRRMRKNETANAWVERARTNVVVSIGQLTAVDKKALDAAVKRGEIAKWRGHWNPDPGAPWGVGGLKTVYGPVAVKKHYFG
jgi:hypothetical protein